MSYCVCDYRKVCGSLLSSNQESNLFACEVGDQEELICTQWWWFLEREKRKKLNDAHEALSCPEHMYPGDISKGDCQTTQLRYPNVCQKTGQKVRNLCEVH